MKKRKRIGAALALVAVILAAGIWISYNFLVVRSYEIASDKAKGEIKIVVLSDLHDHQFSEGNRRLSELVGEQRPDLILLAGDMLSSDSSDSDKMCRLIRSLGEICPVYAALGNHESVYVEKHPELFAQIEEAGAVFLEKEYTDLTVKGTPLRVGGLYGYAFDAEDGSMNPETETYLKAFQETDALKVMISHRPDSFVLGNAAEKWNIDLVVSGHDHGGQVVLPFVGGVYGGDQGWFPPYIHGVKKKGNLTVFVTSGLGSNRQKLPRFLNPPEIAVLTISKPSGSPKE